VQHPAEGGKVIWGGRNHVRTASQLDEPRRPERSTLTVVAELLAGLQVRWDRDAGRWFAFVLVACAVVCFNRL
jgi:hypothetical protein